MKIMKFNELQKEHYDNREKDYIHKGLKILPDLKTAIFAKIKGYVNGTYPEPLSGMAKKIGYYPLSMATDNEIKQINQIEKQVING